MSIKIFCDKIDFRVRNGKKIKKLVEDIVTKEEKISGNINIVFTDDYSIKEINCKFLKHNYFTDVISFSYNTNNEVSGEVYISVDTVKKNAINYNVSLEEELLRVIIHGTLHLCGYEDDNKYNKEMMSEKEDEWLKEFYN